MAALAGCLMMLGLRPALWACVLPADSSFTPELIAACAHSTRAGGGFYSQAQRLEDARHARPHGAKGDIIEAQIPAQQFAEMAFKDGETLVLTPRRAKVFVA